MKERYSPEEEAYKKAIAQSSGGVTKVGWNDLLEKRKATRNLEDVPSDAESIQAGREPTEVSGTLNERIKDREHDKRIKEGARNERLARGDEVYRQEIFELLQLFRSELKGMHEYANQISKMYSLEKEAIFPHEGDRYRNVGTNFYLEMKRENFLKEKEHLRANALAANEDIAGKEYGRFHLFNDRFPKRGEEDEEAVRIYRELGERDDEIAQAMSVIEKNFDEFEALINKDIEDEIIETEWREARHWWNPRTWSKAGWLKRRQKGKTEISDSNQFLSEEVRKKAVAGKIGVPSKKEWVQLLEENKQKANRSGDLED